MVRGGCGKRLAIPATTMLVLGLVVFLDTNLWQSDQLTMALFGVGLVGLAVYLLTLVGCLWRERWRELVLAGTAVAATLLAVELVLRWRVPWLALPPFGLVASSNLHHVLPPNRRMFDGFYREEAVVVATNADGLRSHWTNETFRRASLRIAVLGDSFVMGVGVNSTATMPAQLETALRQRLQRDDVAVLNCGVISYSPFLSIRQYDKVIRSYAPTHVVFLLDASDVGNDRNYRSDWTGSSFKHDGSLIPRHAPTGRAALWTAVRPSLEPFVLVPLQLIGRSCANLAGPSSIPPQRSPTFFIYRHAPRETEPYMRQSLETLSELAAMVEADGAQFLFVLAPRYHHWSSTECPHNWEHTEYGDDEAYEFSYLDFFSREGPRQFSTLALLPAFRQASGGPYVFIDDPHWNARGNRFVAQTIAQRLVESISGN